jgi:hypothetical protein
MRTRVDGVVANIQTMHTWLDLMTTSSNKNFNRTELAQTSNKTTLNTIVARLDVLHTTIRGLQNYSCGHGRRGNDSFVKLKFKIPPYNGKYDPTAYLDWELEVEQQLSYHDISANSQVQTAISESTHIAGGVNINKVIQL